MEKTKKLAVGILAHVDAGKTTLAEGILYKTGQIRKAGRVDHKDAFLDTEELEKARGITIFSKQAVLKLNETEVTLLDTPGHVDFSAEMERTLQVLDYAILVINGADGVQGHTMTLWRLLARYQIPTFLFINKMDQDGTDKEKLLAGGYDLEEIGIKLIDNYIKQVMEDGFFHADPHPGNVKIQDGKIVWIDMGMMGRLTERDKELIGKAIRGIAENDIGMIQEAVMALGEFKEKPDQSVLYEDISELMSKYGSLDMGEIDVAEVMMDLMEVMKENKIRMPHGLTMLARGLTNMEGVLADIAPQINMIEIASRHISESMWKDLDWKKELKHAGKNLYRSMHKAVEVPGLAADALHGLMKGQTRVNLDLHASNDLAQLLRRLVRNVVMGLWVMALLISSSIICTTNMSPKICGIPAIGAIGYLMAFVIVMYVFIKHFLSRK